MSFLSLLVVSTVAIVTLAWITLRRVRTWSVCVGVFFLYYFSLLGGWIVVYDQTGGNTADSGLTYTYLYARLFPVSLDRDYYHALILYAAFIAITILTLALRGIPASKRPGRAPIEISHGTVIVLTAFFGCFTFAFFRAQLGEALASNASAYVLVRGGETDPVYSVIAVIIRMALVPAVIGLATYCAGCDGLYLRGRIKAKRYMVGYVTVIAFMYLLAASLGNKNELLFSMVTGVLFYFANTEKPNTKVLALLSLAAIGLIGAIETLRAVPLDLLLDSLNWKLVRLALLAPFQSNEIFGAHFSLYGVLHYRLPITYGTSLVVLAASVVPRILWSGRPEDIYWYYANRVSATEGQGYTIHHATGWYLNFGIIGVVIGGIVLGSVWAWCHNRFYRRVGSTAFGRVFSCVAPWTFIAGLPSLLRGGPEAYKGLIVNSFVTPTLVLFLAHLTLTRGLSRSKEKSMASIGPPPYGSPVFD